jgi:hypothetical protein
MADFFVNARVGGQQHATYRIEADSREEAMSELEEASDWEQPGELVGRTSGRIKETKTVISAWKADEPECKEWAVKGVYTDTDNLQPFTSRMMAKGPRDALARAIVMSKYTTDKDEVPEMASKLAQGDLAEEAKKVDIRPVSVESTYRLEPGEHLHQIREFN